jgi:predicted DNA-binding protein
MAVTVRFTEKELEAVRAYAEIQGETISAILRDAIFERIEDEMDYRAAVKAHKEWEADGFRTVSHEEVKKHLGLV